MTDLTPAEQAAAEALHRHFTENDSLGIESINPDDFAAEARAVVAAARPIIEWEAVQATAEAIDKDIDRMLHVDTQHKWPTDYMSGVYYIAKLVDLRAEVMEPNPGESE